MSESSGGLTDGRGAGADRASSLVSLIDALTSRPAVDAALATHLAGVREILVAPHTGDAPFLTVMMRTQARRLEAFKDALHCLAAQTCTDFDLLVLAHDVDDVDRDVLQQIINSQPESFSTRIRLVDVRGGGRARPLNAGIELVQGRYVAIFDDDDLVFANWVEGFYEASHLAEGRLLRAICATQVVVPEMWPQDEEGYRSMSWPKAEYARNFNLYDHLIVNHSPFMSWAFPSHLFRILGVRFDEQLAVCEDWDVILQGALLVGVEDVDSLTSIYRRWDGGSSSYTVHSSDEWRASEKRVVDRLDSMAHVLPVGGVGQLRRRSLRAEPTDSGLAAQLHAIHTSRSWRVIQRMRHILVPARRLVGRLLRALRLRK